MYKVFKRKAWHKIGGEWRPNATARKTTVQHVDTTEEAIAICKPHNAKRPATGTAGYYNFTFYEFTSI